MAFEHCRIRPLLFVEHPFEFLVDAPKQAPAQDINNDFHILILDLRQGAQEAVLASRASAARSVITSSILLVAETCGELCMHLLSFRRLSAARTALRCNSSGSSRRLATASETRAMSVNSVHTSRRSATGNRGKPLRRGSLPRMPRSFRAHSHSAALAGEAGRGARLCAAGRPDFVKTAIGRFRQAAGSEQRLLGTEHQHELLGTMRCRHKGMLRQRQSVEQRHLRRLGFM